MSRLALLSVSDKKGLVPFAEGLVARGFTLLSTGGTAKALLAAGLPVTKVSEHTGAPEIFDGRVKTLHPRIHGGILGRRGLDDAVAAEQGIAFIDVVVVNLYPFEATVLGGASLGEAIEQIDIGGPAMVRAAAKNHASVYVVVDPGDYESVLGAVASGGDSADAPALRGRLAVKAYRHTATYDSVVSSWLAARLDPAGEPAELAIPLRRVQGMRYGENPHQSAAFYSTPGEGGRSLARATQLQGKELSFNNLADLDATLRVVFEFDEPAAVIVKHMNPCGAAVHPDGVAKAYVLALSADPVSAYGGILAFNRPMGAVEAQAILDSKVFYEVIAAPGVDTDARALLASKKNLRVMELPADWAASRPAGQDARRVQGGWLLQDWDVGHETTWVEALRSPTVDEARALRFAWALCRNVKSNAIVLATLADGGVVQNGVGAGQMSRVDSVKLAVAKARRPTAGSVLASDAFFPFADGVEVAVAAGITAIVQPGGSIRDEEVLATARGAGMAMSMTGARHFRH
ncbi:MAG: bifunctional phosphoribosylaminoimidazolecarboxamide formyltransferase/IMP cyclohydrolase [Pseudomonadota bacterium]|nr:bifunctional phosphoribosylaminoimidazolecarboxamide formyltransferase/IMP cyclohydrolase [Pseudomonadota bacterium]